MDYQILIHDFVDGTLDKSQEENLFLALSSSEELRNELRQTIALEKAFSKKLSAFAPSAKSTVAIFSGLSMAIPGSVANAGVAASTKTIAFITKYMQAILGSLATALVATSVFFAVSSYNSNDKESATVPANSVVNKSADYVNNSFDLPRMSSIDVTETIVKADSKSVPVKSSSNLNIADRVKDETVFTQAESSELTEFINFSEIQNNQSNIFTRNDFTTNSYYSKINSENYPLFINSELKGLGLSLEFHGNQYVLLQKNEVPQSSNPLFSNAGITLLYNFNENLSVGLDLRQEFIYQKFEGTDEEGNQYLYKQYPNYLNLSAVLRYGFNINEWLDFYSQLMVGGTVTGAMVRSGVGFKISPYPDLNFLLGFDGMIFGYQHQNKFYESSKLGLNFGIGFNF